MRISDWSSDVCSSDLRHGTQGHQPCLLCLRRLGGGGSRAENGAAVFRRDRPAAAQAFHRPPAELSRQHGRRAQRRRQCLAAPALRADADGKSVGKGKRVSVLVNLGGGRIIKKKKRK